MTREFYIQAIADGSMLTRDYKELIPDATMRRRMSKILKCGVATGMECLAVFGENVDAIITGSGFGCLQDSEKFLRSVVENNEVQLNPTPFIQSTFNTIGAQIALLCRNHSYNVTYSHGGDSFSHALVDACMLLNEGSANQVLLGIADEITPTLKTIMDRLNIRQSLPVGEYAVFVVLSSKRTEQTIASFQLYSEAFTGNECDEEDLAYRFFPVSYANQLLHAVNKVRRGEENTVDISIGNQKLFNKVGIRCC